MRLLIITQKVDTDDDVLGFFHTWVRKIAEKVESVLVICLAKGEYNLPQNVKVVSLGKESGYPKIIQAMIFYWYAFRFLPQSDGIFIHMAPEYVRAISPVNFFFKRPIIMWYAHIKVSQIAKRALERVDKIFTPSKESFAFPTDKVISTGHGIDTEKFSPTSSTEFRVKKQIVSLSRISRVKRIETLVEAVNILVKDNKQSNFTVKIYGRPARPEDEAYQKMLKEKIAAYGLESFFEWEGPVANREAPAVYQNTDVFVRLQGGGGFGKTELEAMACGTPVILCTPVYNDTLKEYSEDMYFEENNPKQLANSIVKVLSWSEDKRALYGLKVRQLVKENHNIDFLAARIVKEMEYLVKSKE